ncbi:MAG: GH3 auxin-responsive promoter [Woeseiaceae bacterium]|nr:GH3 auxin-responsive promoter [Woeseiaceae bacterium]
MSTTATIANIGWLAASVAESRRYRRDAGDIERVQRSRLAMYLRRNADTDFGRRHGFAGLSGWEDFVRKVPVQGYDDVEPYIRRIAGGENRVLTAEPVRLFEPSSGSSGPAKWIPYTAAMQREIRRAVAVWATAMFRSQPGLLFGPAYWSLTPQLSTPGASESSIPVGFDDDSAYLGGLAQRLIQRALVTHPALRGLTDTGQFLDATLVLLLRRPDLRLVSVWHPSFLTLLMKRLRVNWGPLLDSVGNGRLPGIEGIRLETRRARARQLDRLGCDDLISLWPQLGLISCWADGHAEAYVPKVRELFPGVALQPKGLVATEAMVTMPVGGLRPLAIRSHVFEFLDAAGEAHPPWQLAPGQQYVVLVTTGGGLYRYRLGDRVEVEGFYRGVPALRFLGKEDQVSDYFGEKLSEPFVASVLDNVLATLEISPVFSLLAIDERADPPAYALYVETQHGWPDSASALLENGLRKNPHYDYCRRIGQLGTAKIIRVGPGAFGRYAERLTETGMRLGDVKAASLSSLSHWQNWLLDRGDL